MKPFNLEESKAGKPVCTRDGNPARIICWDRKDDEFPIVALVYEFGKEFTKTYRIDGRYFSDCNDDSDLMMHSVKKEGWVNVYKNESGYETGVTVYDDEDSSIIIGRTYDRYITTVKIEWEE